MSEILGEARVIIRPDTTRFRAQLQEEVNRAVSQTLVPPISIPVAFGAGQGLAAAAASTAALVASQERAVTSTLGLTKAGELENTTFGRQAVIMQAATAATTEKAGADAAAAGAARGHAVAQGQIGKAAVASTAGMLGLRGAVLTAGTAFIAATVGFQALGKAIGSAISFERELNVFQETAGATADEMSRISDAARELGRDITLPGVSAADAAETLSLLARAGLDVNESLGAVRGTLQLATAAEIENAQATELVANALNAFKLEGADAARVADLFAGAANESQGSIVDMGIALRQAAAVSSGLGISIEDTITLLTQLSQAGLTSSDAGTSLRQTFLRLIQDLPKVNDEVERLGLNLRDASGNIRPEIFEELGVKLRKLTPAARQTAIANLGGADAIRTYLLLSREAVGTFDAVQAAISEQGSAADLAAARTEGLGGDVEAAKNQFADLGITVGNVASGPLSTFVRAAGGVAGALNEVNREVGESAGGQGFAESFGNFVNRFTESFARMNVGFRQGVQGAREQGDAFSTLGAIADTTTSSINALADALENAASEALEDQGQPQDTGLGVQQVLNRVQGFDSAETRARIRGDTDELLSVLQAEQDFLQGQLERQFVQNRPALRDRLQDALLGAIQDVESISKEGASEAKRVASETKRLADEAERARDEADRAFLALLGDRREDAANTAAALAAEGSVRAAIAAQNRLQALIRNQIQKIRDRVKDEQARKEAIRELRIARNASQREEEALRQEEAAAAAARQGEIQQLNIDIAIETENDAALKRAINARIKTINKAIEAAKGDQVRIKQLILERERLKNQLEDATEKEKETGKSAQQFFFEQLQAQQGFAANLMGNLIPRDQTAGLVGVPSPDIGRQVRGEAARAEGRAFMGPTAGQGNTEISLLGRILDELKSLNRHSDAPEAKEQRRAGSADMDGSGGAGGGVSAVM